MQLISIRLENIKSHRDTELSFSAGINVLSGPNGAGKSTVFEAIGYALFGVDARDFVSNVDRFLTIGAKRGKISVTFRTDDQETWQVSRTVGAAAKWLLAKENGGAFEVEEHARLEETGARIAELLGLDNGRPLAEQFKLVIGPFQNEFLGPFIIKQPTKRQEAFDEILGIDAWRKTYKGTSVLVSALQERLKVLAAEVAGKQEQLLILPDRAAELAAGRSELVLRQQGLRDGEDSLVAVEKRLFELETWEKAIAALENDIQVLENRIKDGSAKIDEQQLRVKESQQALKIVEESRAGKEAFDRVEAHLADLRHKQLLRRGLEQEIAGLEKEALRLSQTLEHEQAEIAKVGTQLAAEQEKLSAARTELQPDARLTALANRLPELCEELEAQRRVRALLAGRRESLLEGRDKLGEGVCPFFQEQCRNIAGAAPRVAFSGRIAALDEQASGLDEVLAQLTLQLKAAETAARELDKRTARLQELDKQAASLEERRTGNRERAGALDSIITQQAEAARLVNARRTDLRIFADLDAGITQAEQEHRQHQAARDAYTANLNVAGDLDNREQNLQKMIRLLEVLTEERTAKQTELASTKVIFQPDQLLLTRQDKERLLAEIATLRQQTIDLARTIDRLDAEISRLTAVQLEIEAKRGEIRSGEKKEKLVKFLRSQVFKNVSAQLSERFREEISLRADRIYRTIAEADEELVWGENYQIVLRDLADGAVRERSDDQLSGGQTMSAVVALRLALLQTIGARIAFFDEPTSNLDASRRENLAHAFRAIDVGREEVTEHWYDQLFLISHDVAFTEITDQMLPLGE